MNRRRRGLRTGYTTGACATAAAKAATQVLLTSRPVRQVTIRLPIGREACFTLHRCQRQGEGVLCSVIKDAGDDPDVTHGAEICASVRWVETPGVWIKGGEGVGIVTRPGLGLEVGAPAINPVPRRMIDQHVREVVGERLATRGLEVTVSVPGGEVLAKRTLNPRLGIVGGISILGTTGIVRPFSTAAWRASVLQAIDVAAANGVDHVVLTTGSRSERFAMAALAGLGLPELAFVEMGEFAGAALRRCRERRIPRVTVCGMIGKFAKMAQGHAMTHVAGNQVDFAFLAGLAAAAGAPPAVVAAIRAANTARHVQELCLAAGVEKFFTEVARQVCHQAAIWSGGACEVDAILFDFDGRILARAGRVGAEGRGSPWAR